MQSLQKRAVIESLPDRSVIETVSVISYGRLPYWPDFLSAGNDGLELDLPRHGNTAVHCFDAPQIVRVSFLTDRTAGAAGFVAGIELPPLEL